MTESETKPKLQSITPFKLMDIKEALDTLGWTYTEVKDNGFDDISCPCGGEISFYGFFGVERATCKSCQKHMVDILSPQPINDVSCTILDSDRYDFSDNKYWIVFTDKDTGILKD